MDEALDDKENTETVFSNATATPARIQGQGKVVYWRNCSKVILGRGNEKVRDVDRKTGKGRLPAGLKLYFFGDGGEAKEE